MKGLEPSTFCMASRRSSQLSYIREGPDYSGAAPSDLGPTERSVELPAQQRGDVIRLWVAPEHGLREHELTVHVHVEDPIRARYYLERADHAFPLLEDSRRQTGGVREGASGDAVLDPHVVAFGHRGDSLRRPPSQVPPRRAPR
jgi:hypothetical protein